MISPAIHPTARVSDRALLGDGCRVDAHAVVEGGCVIEAGARVGVRATVVSPGDSASASVPTVVKEGATVGTGAIVHGPLSIGRGAIVNPGSVVTTDVPAHAIVAGNPATIIGYTQTDTNPVSPFVASPKVAGQSVDVAGARLSRHPRVVDIRGSLTFAEVGRGLPFVPRRIFIVFDVSNRYVRGSHAHRRIDQYLIAIGGRVSIALDNGYERSQVQLGDADLGLHIPPMVWATQYDYAPGATLVVLASAEYDDAEYIRDYDEFLEIVRGN